MNFGQAVSEFFRNYANFKGRSRRSAYWYAYLFVQLTTVVVMILSYQEDPYTGEPTYGPLFSIWILGTITPALACAVRRMHDVGQSGWMVLVPLANLFLLTTDSQSGDNKYGAPVK